MHSEQFCNAVPSTNISNVLSAMSFLHLIKKKKKCPFHGIHKRIDLRISNATEGDPNIRVCSFLISLRD